MSSHLGHKVMPWNDEKGKFEWFCETCNTSFKLDGKADDGKRQKFVFECVARFDEEITVYALDLIQAEQLIRDDRYWRCDDQKKKLVKIVSFKKRERQE